MEKELHIMGEEKRAELKSEGYRVKMLTLSNMVLLKEYRALERQAIWFAGIAIISLVLNILQFVF